MTNAALFIGDLISLIFVREYFGPRDNPLFAHSSHCRSESRCAL